MFAFFPKQQITTILSAGFYVIPGISYRSTAGSKKTSWVAVFSGHWA
jgi:hypothetical protein